MKGFEKQARRTGHQNSLAKRQAKIAERRAQLVADMITLNENFYDNYFSLKFLWDDLFSPDRDYAPLYPSSESTFKDDMKAVSYTHLTLPTIYSV